jgi:hypothetical protein
MAWTLRSGTRQEFRLSRQITGSLRDFRYKFPLCPRHGRPEGERDCVHAAKIDQKPTSVNPTLQACRCPVRPGKALASHSTDGVMAGDWHVMSSPCGAQSASLTEIVCQRPKGALCSLRRNSRRSPASYRGRLIRRLGLCRHVQWQCTGCVMALGWRVASFPAIS